MVFMLPAVAQIVKWVVIAIILIVAVILVIWLVNKFSPKTETKTSSYTPGICKDAYKANPPLWT